MKDLKRFLDIVFLPDDTICVSDSKYAYHSMPVSSILKEEVTLVSPNQKVENQIIKVDNLNLIAINPIKGFRNDDNVYRYQSFLWEIDIGSLQNQWDYVIKLGVPYTLAIYSGGKSIHFLTVLEESIDKDTYKIFYEWALNIGTLFDQNCRNPSRCVRIPGNIRLDSQKEQKLLGIKEKIKISDFLEWLEKYPNCKPKKREDKRNLTDASDYEKISPWAKKQFKKGIDFSQGRNRAWFALSCDLAKSGYIESEATEILLSYFIEEKDFKERELLATIASAFKYMEKQ